MTAKLQIETFPNEAAADYIKGKAVADPKNFGNLPPQLKQRAFTVAGIEQMDMLRKLRDTIAKLPAGANWDDVKKELAADLSDYVGGDAKAAKARAEHLLRVQGFQAYAVARHQQQMATVKSHPYWMYETVGDNRVRPGHAALDGKVLRADDPWWKTHYPPWDWGCRCIVIALDEEDAQEFGISEHNDMPSPERSGTYTFDASDAGISLDALTQGRDDADCRIMADQARRTTVQNDDDEKVTMWDYMLNRHMNSAAQKFGSNSKIEHAVVVDFDTGKTLGVFHGDENSVNPFGEDGKDAFSGHNITTLHTHPSNNPTPSPNDLLEFFNHNAKINFISAGGETRRYEFGKESFDGKIVKRLQKFASDMADGNLDMIEYYVYLADLVARNVLLQEVKL